MKKTILLFTIILASCISYAQDNLPGGLSQEETVNLMQTRYSKLVCKWIDINDSKGNLIGFKKKIEIFFDEKQSITSISIISNKLDGTDDTEQKYIQVDVATINGIIIPFEHLVHLSENISETQPYNQVIMSAMITLLKETKPGTIKPMKKK